MSFIKELLQGLLNTGRVFCVETSVHGFYHIAAPNRHIVERALWASITGLAIYIVVGISQDQWQRYNENPTVVTLEKDFRNWKFPLPGITECSSNKSDPEKAKQLVNTLWHVTPGDDRFPYYMAFVDAVVNSNLTHLDGFKDFAEDPTLNVDLYQIAIAVMPDYVVRPTWVDNLNPKWIPVMTESGVCYTANSVAIDDVIIRASDRNQTPSAPVSCKYSSFSCYVTLEAGQCVKFFFHSPYDVAETSSSVADLCPLYNRNIALSVTESVCGPGVRELSVGRRRCLYSDEPTTSHTSVYSTNMCRRACRNQVAIQLCGCKPFYNFYEEGAACSTTGMACLSQYKDQLLAAPCPCSPQCIDAVYQELSYEEMKWAKGAFMNRGSLRVTLQAPKEKYTREIVFHFHDLVVSFGGAAGFFLGASFLSFTEILYFLIERIICCCFKKGRQRSSRQESINTTGEPRERTFESWQIEKLTSVLDRESNTNYRWSLL